jgi:hypothetical protein
VGTCEFAAAEYTFAWTAAGALYKVLADDTATLVAGVTGVTACAITLTNGDTDLPSGRVWVGCSDGSVFRSSDHGATWEEMAPLPNGEAATYIGESPFAEGDVEAAAANVYYRTFDNGASWTAQFTHPNAALIARRVASGFGKGWAGFSGSGDDLAESRLQERDDAVELDADEPDKPINVVGLALDPFEDVIYVLDDLGSADARLFSGDSANGGNLTELADWDDALWSTPRHMIRDGTAAGYLYISSTNYLLKSVDGGATILELKAILGDSAQGRMLGYGAERVTSLALDVVSTAGEDKMLGLWNGSDNDDPPAGWYAFEYDDSAWGLAIEKTGQTAPPLTGTQAIWYAHVAIGLEEALVRRTFAIPPGRITTATLLVKVDNFIDGAWLNGIELAGVSDEEPFPTWTYDVTAAARAGRTNTLAILARNGPVAGFTAPDWVSYRLEVR